MTTPIKPEWASQEEWDQTLAELGPDATDEAARMATFQRRSNPYGERSTRDRLRWLAEGGAKAMAGAGIIAGGMALAGAGAGGAAAAGTPTVNSLPLVSGAKGAGMALNWANIVPSLVSGVTGLLGSKEEADGASDAAAISQRQFDTVRGDVLPRINAGNAAVDVLARLQGLYTGTPDPSLHTTDPGYQFIRDEGLSAVDRRGAATGKFNSGQRDKERIRYAGGVASQDYGSFVDRLLATANMGTTGANTSAAAGANNAAYGGNAAQNRGAARSSGYASLNNAFQGYQSNQLLQQYLQRNPVAA